MNARNLWIAVIALFCAALLIRGPHYLDVRQPALFGIVLVIALVAARFIPAPKKSNEVHGRHGGSARENRFGNGRKTEAERIAQVYLEEIVSDGYGRSRGVWEWPHFESYPAAAASAVSGKARRPVILSMWMR